MADSRRVRLPRRARKARNGKYKFSDKTHPVEGIVSFGLAVLSIALVFGAVLLSERAAGKGTAIVGALGVIALLATISGVVLAIVAFQKKEIHYRFPIFGVVINGGLTIFLVVLYLLGMAA